MQTYPVRPDHRRLLSAESLAEVARHHFESVTVSATEMVASYGALERLSAQADGRQLRVDVRMNPKVPEAVARETIARYNRFLEEATGYSAKERAKRLRKSASE